MRSSTGLIPVIVLAFSIVPPAQAGGESDARALMEEVDRHYPQAEVLRFSSAELDDSLEELAQRYLDADPEARSTILAVFESTSHPGGEKTAKLLGWELAMQLSSSPRRFRTLITQALRNPDSLGLSSILLETTRSLIHYWPDASWTQARPLLRDALLLLTFHSNLDLSAGALASLAAVSGTLDPEASKRWQMHTVSAETNALEILRDLPAALDSTSLTPDLQTRWMGTLLDLWMGQARACLARLEPKPTDR